MADKKRARRPEHVAFAERFTATLRARRMSQADVARALGIEAQSITRWVKGEVLPQTKRQPALARLLGVSIEWLLTGSTRQADNGAAALVAERGRLVPKLIAADAVLELRPATETEFFMTYFPCSESAYMIPVEDDSNAPEFSIGDCVVIDPEAPLAPGKMILLAVGTPPKPFFGRYVRRMINGASGEILKHLNSAWGERVIDRAKDTIKGVMTEHTRPAR